MPLKSGLNAQLGFAAETTWGTPVTVTKFVPLVSESIVKEVARLESSGIIAGRRVLSTNQFTGGDVTVSGDIQLEVALHGIGSLWKWMLGSATTTSTGGSAPYTHTCTPGDLSDDHLTVQVGRPNVGGTVDAFTYSGIKCASWELAGSAGELATLGLSVVGKDEATNTALVTATFTNGVDQSFSYINGAISIVGSSVNVKDFKISGDNGLAERRFVSDRTVAEPLEAALREYGGELTCEWEGLTQYNRFVAGATVPLIVTLSAGSGASVTITTNVRFDGSTPTVQGREILEQSIPFKCVAATDAGAITVAVVNSDATV